MRVPDEQLASDDVVAFLANGPGLLAKDEEGIHITYTCGCKWRRVKIVGGYAGELDLCFRHEVLEVAAREEMNREARRHRAADRDGRSSALEA